MPLSNNDLLIKDANAANQTLIYTVSGGKLIPTTLLRDAEGVLISPTNPFSVTEPPRIPATANFTRPADTTAYAFGDLVANSTTAGSVTPLTIAAARANDQPGQIIAGTLRKSGTGVTNPFFRVHLYRVSPTVTNGDNGAFSTPIANWLGCMDVTVAQVGTDGCIGNCVPFGLPSIPFLPATGTQNVFALIEARGAYAPANAEVFTLELDVL